MAHLTTRQIKQLIEIDNAGPGIRSEVQDMISRLTSGGVGAKSDDQRIAQAKRLWDKGWGRELKIDSFDEYLSSIPEIPERPPIDYLDRLVLVDRRVKLTTACELVGLGLAFSGDEETLVPFDPEKAKKDVEWMWCQAGHRNRGKAAKGCREECRKGEIVCDTFEGVAIYTQDPKVTKGHYLDLPGSVRADGHGDVAYLGRWSDGPGLSWRWDGHEGSHYGSASRWE